MEGLEAVPGASWLDIVSKIAESLGGLATAIALVCALWSLRQSREQLRIAEQSMQRTQSKDRAERERLLEAQARKVRAWGAVHMQQLPDGSKKPKAWGLVIANDSDQFVYDVHVHRAASITGNGSRIPGVDFRIDLIPPGRHFLADGQSMPHPIDTDECDPIYRNANFHPTLEFTDAMENRWVRRTKGRLERLKPGAASPDLALPDRPIRSGR